MLILRGAPALSEFRVNKILARCKQSQLPVTNVYAEYAHFADLTSPLSVDEQTKLEKLLTYGPTIAEHTPAGTLILVTPRPGTISPWASKATDIAHNCGLKQVHRVERGIAYYIEGELSAEQLAQATALLHDRMTEATHTELEAAAQLFRNDSPREMSSVDILGGGREALAAANVEQGFASLEEAADAIATYTGRAKRSNLEGLKKNLRLDNGRYYWHWDPKFLQINGAYTGKVDQMMTMTQSIQCPMLLVRGHLSDLVTEDIAQDFLSKMPNCEYVSIEKARHMVVGDRNDIFADAVLDFIQRL